MLESRALPTPVLVHTPRVEGERKHLLELPGRLESRRQPLVPVQATLVCRKRAPVHHTDRLQVSYQLYVTHSRSSINWDTMVVGGLPWFTRGSYLPEGVDRLSWLLDGEVMLPEEVGRLLWLPDKVGWLLWLPERVGGLPWLPEGVLLWL